MKNTFSILLLVMLQSLVFANGRSSLFEHLDKGSRTIEGEGRFRISGHRENLVFRFSGPERNRFTDWSGGVVSFPDKRAFLIDANGKKFQLKIVRSQDDTDRWTALIANGQQLPKGLYSLRFAIEINRTEYQFEHRFQYSFENIDIHSSETSNRYKKRG